MRIYVAGHRGMVGSAVVRALDQTDHTLLTAGRNEVDLTSRSDVAHFMRDQRPDAVIMAAAKVGGIMANSTYPADFIQDNLRIATNVVEQAHAAGVKKLINLGSSCIYPRDAAQPISEDALMTGPLEPTNEPYAIAKIAAIKLCESYNRQFHTDYRSLMPTNLYGPGDNFHPEHSHVLPALIQRFHDAVLQGKSQVTIWGSGTPRREFLHVDDMASATLFFLSLDAETVAKWTQPNQSHINVGTGRDISIADLAQTIARITGFDGRVVYDTSRPDGTSRKLLNIERLTRMGWSPRIDLSRGIEDTYKWYKNQLATGDTLRSF